MTVDNEIIGPELLSERGRAAVGAVDKAAQTALNRTAAVRRLNAGDHADTHSIQRMRNEAERAYREKRLP